MDQYITGSTIKALREERKLTQRELSERLSVSDKAVSKWETGRGYPDISLIGPLSEALDVSVAELMPGERVFCTNRSFNMMKTRFYVCPVCGNAIASHGEAAVSCCGITLPRLEPEEPDYAHAVVIEDVEDEFYVSADHPMTKEHYISFIAAVRDDSFEMVRLYPEGNAEARFKRSRTKYICWYCNRDGFFRTRIRRK